MKTFLGLTIAAATMAAGVMMAGPVHAAAHAAAKCGEPIADPRPAFNAQGLAFGSVIAEIKGEDGDASGYVLQEAGFKYGYTGGSRVLPAEFVEFAAGRALIKLRDPDAVKSFPSYSC